MQPIQGPDFNKIDRLDTLLEYYQGMGIQSTNMYKAVQEINRMIEAREQGQGCKIVLGYTSNMVSSGVREIIRYMVEHRLVDCIVTTTGAIEEDIIKCTAHFYVGSFQNDDTELRNQQLMRIGNIYLKNENYQNLEDWLQPVMEQLDQQQQKDGLVVSASKLIQAMGQKIDNKESIYYWCHRNNIPVLCPALTDGAVGDMLYTFSFRHDRLIVDQMSDYRLLQGIMKGGNKVGAIMLGSGLIEQHIIKAAERAKNGLDYCVMINTDLHIDTPRNNKYIRVFSEVTLVLPYLVALTFYKWMHK